LTVDGRSGNGGTTYIYDAEGLRVGRTNTSGTRGFTYDLAGRVVADYTSNGLQRGEVYAGGRHLATYINNLTYFSSVDRLGNERLRWTQDGSSMDSCAMGLPFGDGWTCWGNQAWNSGPLHFTGDERDTESNLDHTWFRQYSSAQGRWTTPDPYLGSMDLSNPQSLNRYAYVGGNPVTFIDPLGLRMTEGDCGPFNSACGGGGGGGGGWGVEECGVDPFCIAAGGIGPFGSPVAQIHCDDDGRCMTGSWNFAQYHSGGAITVDWAAQRNAEIDLAVHIFMDQASKVAAQLHVSLDDFLAAQNLDAQSAQQPFLHGGNWNFLIPTSAQIPEGCTRCGIFPSIHFPGSDYVHLDTANPLRGFGAGLVTHFVVDVLLGNSFFAGGIPRP
jgi:RHS repeat-associated protein